MKKMSRLLAVIMALVLAMGCVQFASAENTYPEGLENVDLIYWCISNPDQKDAELVHAEMEKYALAGMNVNLDMVIVATSEYKDKFSKAMAAKERIDLAWIGYVHSAQELCNMGALTQLDDLINEYGPDLLASLDPMLIDAHRLADGGLYYFPAWQGMVGNRSFYMFQKDQIDATVGVEWVEEMQKIMYENWDSWTVEARLAPYKHLETFLAALKEQDLLELGYCPVGESGLGGWWDAKAKTDVGKGSIKLWDDTFTVFDAKTSEVKEAIGVLMAEWYEKGYIREDIASIEDTQDARIAGFKDTTSLRYLMYGHNGFTDDLSKEIAGFVRPVYTVHTNPFCWTTSGSATGTCIPFTAAEPERAMMFMNWLLTDDENASNFYNTFSYGIEGMHYEWNEEHTDITTFGGNGQASAEWDWGQRPWSMGTLLNAYSCPVYPAWYYDELIALQEKAATSPLLGFSFDNSFVMTEYDLVTAIDKEYEDIGRGHLGVEGFKKAFAEYKDKLYAAGYQTVLDEAQAQVNDYIERTGLKWVKPE